jgi:serine/threonine protein kinase
LDAPVWNDISDHAKDLLQQLLCVDPNDRLSVHEALEHRWLKVKISVILIQKSRCHCFVDRIGISVLPEITFIRQ